MAVNLLQAEIHFTNKEHVEKEDEATPALKANKVDFPILYTVSLKFKLTAVSTLYLKSKIALHRRDETQSSTRDALY